MAGDTFRGDSAANLFQGGAGQDTYFLGAADTDGTPEFKIQLSGFVPLSVEDFYL